MKKYFLSLMTILMVALVSVSVISCGDDDDEPMPVEPTNPNPDNPNNPSTPNNPNDGNNNRGPVASSFKGSGTKSDPYIISTAAELRKLADDVTDKGKAYVGAYFSQTADITINKNVLNSTGELSGYGPSLEEWKTIGKYGVEQFSGTYEGNNHTIYGIYIKGSDDNVALFYGGRIQNLTLKDTYIEGKYWVSSFGGFDIYNCTNYGTVKGESCSGIGGLSIEDIVEKCKNHGKVCGKIHAAGISIKANVNMCVNYGNISSSGNSSSSSAAGISGYQGMHGVTTNCCNLGRVSGEHVAGISYALTGKYESERSHVINNVNCGVLEGTHGGGIICNAGYAARLENNVNVGRNEGGSETCGIYYSSVNANITSKFKNNYYLSSSYLYRGKDENGYNGENNRNMTEYEMKSQSFLDELNSNARMLGNEYSRWKFGKNGFPILEWVEE